MKVIAICGPKRSGKDTISSILKASDYTNIKISSELKNCCKLLFGLSDEQLETDDKDKIDSTWNCKPRELMQFIGTDVMQFHIQRVVPHIGRTFWINKTVEKIKFVQTPVVISDLRFIHEYELLKRTFGEDLKVWKVDRPCIKTDKTSNHCSELEWKDIPHDVFLNNNGTISDLKAQVDDIFTKS